MHKMADVWMVRRTLLAVVAYYIVQPTDAYKYFSTKTPYAWGHPPQENETEDHWFNEIVDDLICSAIHTSIVARHGTRHPGQDDVNKLSEIHSKIKTEQVQINFPDLYEWNNPFPNNNKKSLADLGEQELHDFGKRTAQRLFSLFAEEDPDSFRYIISSTDRSRDSARAFQEGVADVLRDEPDQEEDEYDSFEPEVVDKLLRFHTLCDKYVKSVAENNTAMKEYYAFQSGELVKKIKEKVTEKLGVPEDTLTASDIRTIYLSCGYEAAIFESSPWCKLLDDEDMKTLEYLGDLKHYYKNGGGYSITWQQACPLVSDIFYTMDDAIESLEMMDGSDEEEGYIIGQFAFGHAETLGPLYAAFGLFNDSVPLRADNYQEQENRHFRSSFILPFAANMQFILYECEPQDQHVSPEDEESEHNPNYYLKLLVNEKPQRILGCDADLCPYKTIRERYKNQIDECNFINICSVHTRDEL